jgi:hypothetical protein
LEPATGDCTQPNHAGAKYDAGRARSHLGGVDGGAKASRQAAREQRGPIGGRFRGNLRQSNLRHHRVFGERARPHEVSDRLTIPEKPSRAVGHVTLVLLLADRQAQVRAVTSAVLTFTTQRREQGDDSVADGYAADSVNDPLDDPATFVSQYRRRVS